MLNLQICNSAQKRRICRKNSKYASHENFCGLLCRKAANFCHLDCHHHHRYPRPTSWLRPSAPLGQILNCHCITCRQQSGALAVPFAALPRTSLRFAPQLQTFKASPLALRLFCKDCGAFVGMDYQEEHTVWISLGSLRKLPDNWAITKVRDCQTFLESKCSWEDDIQALPHLASYGIFKPDPCRPGGGLEVEVNLGNVQEMLKSVITN